MRRHLSYVVGLAILAGACSPGVNVEQERTALMQRDRDWSQTTTDVNKFMSFFAADGSMYATGMPVISGADAVRQTFMGMSSAPGFSLTWTAAKADVSAAGDIGYTAGTYSAAMGGPVEKGKYITVWTKQAGAWMVKEDIFNADGPPPPPPHAMVAPGDFKWGDPPQDFRPVVAWPSSPETRRRRCRSCSGFKCRRATRSGCTGTRRRRT